MLEKAEKQERSDRGVLCAKCEHLNAYGTNECSRCGSHLYVSCVDCGHRVERVRSRCDSCGRRLHRSVLQRFSRKFFRRGLALTPTQIVLFIICVAAGEVAIGLAIIIALYRNKDTVQVDELNILKW